MHRTKTKAGMGGKRVGRPVVRVPLREMRERRALSLSDLGALCGVDRMTIYRVEQGRSTPYPQTRRKIAEALKVDVGEILWEEQTDGDNRTHGPGAARERRGGTRHAPHRATDARLAGRATL